MSDAKKYLTIEEVAGRFGVTAGTVYRLAQQGKLPGFKVGGQWRFSEPLLDSWVVDQITAERLKADAPSSGGRRRGRGNGASR